MRDHSPNTAQAAVPDAVSPPAQRWKTPAASNLPQADAAAFIQASCEASEPFAEPTRTAITSGNPDDAERGFSKARAQLVAQEAAARHERLCAKAKGLIGVSGRTEAARGAYKALHARLRAELDAGKGA